MSPSHHAAILSAAGTPLKIVQRDTPEPGPGEVLIETKAVALNPVDYYQRDFGMPPVPIFPAVIGGDVAGVVSKVGSEVSTALCPGARVIAFASSFFHEGSPDHGAFQEFALARSQAVTILPDHLSFEEGAILPLATLTALSAYTTMGISIGAKFTPSEKKAILVWGASSSVGSLAVQTARLMGFTVYATAGSHNLDYVKKLGAHAAFDYKSADVVSQIISRANEDAVELSMAHMVVEGGLQKTIDVIKLTRGEHPGNIAHSPMLPDDAPTSEGIAVKFNSPPTAPEDVPAHLQACYSWLDHALSSGELIPSPRVEIVEGGLEGLNHGLDLVKGGVSATKVVVPLN